jgi:DNA helicase-2/ATP-dependent DNA helicase PcrA
MIKDFQGKIEDLSAAQMLTQVMEMSGYITELQQKGTDEADNRLENISELHNAMEQFAEDTEDSTLMKFLENASLASDLDELQENTEKVSMMTLHSAKGLEFPIVFLVGLEQGLLPHSRSLGDVLSLEEERRLCYVGITRAQEKLFLTYAQERFVWGNRETKLASQFLGELPSQLLTTNFRSKARKTKERLPSADSPSTWSVGDRLLHPHFGEGEITHVLGSGAKISLAVKFGDLGQKIIDPRVTYLEPMS